MWMHVNNYREWIYLDRKHLDELVPSGCLDTSNIISKHVFNNKKRLPTVFCRNSLNTELRKSFVLILTYVCRSLFHSPYPLVFFASCVLLEIFFCHCIATFVCYSCAWTRPFIHWPNVVVPIQLECEGGKLWWCYGG
jgi:hypothetical protein